MRHFCCNFQTQLQIAASVFDAKMHFHFWCHNVKHRKKHAIYITLLCLLFQLETTSNDRDSVKNMILAFFMIWWFLSGTAVICFENLSCPSKQVRKFWSFVANFRIFYLKISKCKQIADKWQQTNDKCKQVAGQITIDKQLTIL